jgi:hypothetical protein
MTGTVDWRSLEETLAAAACDEPDEQTAEQAVRAAELVASTAGEPPDDLTPEDREWHSHCFAKPSLRQSVSSKKRTPGIGLSL